MRSLLTGIVWFALLATPAFAAEPAADYLREVKPILRARCYACHGALKQEAALRLDAGALIRKGGDSGPAIAAGKPAESLLLERVSAKDESVRMPPEGEPLTTKQIAALRKWIRAGAPSPADERPEADPRKHWAFLQPQRPQPPASNPQWARNAIDSFIAAEHARGGVRPAAPAARSTLMRRAYLDLIGLPPTRNELHAFLADTRPDAYERMVDRLLASPQYAERWGRHWMDVWRYSDWYGRRAVNDVRNSYPHIWRWRDWIIRSLAEDRGYDRMVREMLAADEIAPNDDEAIAATGYLVRNWFSLNYDQWMKDLVEHTGKAFLGLRLNCAHCHDHKYDPIRQEEYFRFRAFFEPLEFRHDRVPGGPRLNKYIRYRPGSGASLKPVAAALARIYDHDLQAKTYMYRLGDSRDRMDRPPVPPGVPAALGGELKIQPVDLPPEGWYPALKTWNQQQEIASREKSVAEARRKLTAARAKAQQESQRLGELRRRVAKLKEKANADSEAPPRPEPVRKSDPRLLANWRFEGSPDKGFLSDSSGNRHTLTHVRGRDPQAAPHALASDARGAAFFNPLPETGTANRQAARFSQRKHYAYLQAAGSPAFYQNEFTLEALVHFETSAINFNRTIADYSGSWTLLHRGLNDREYELRVRLFDQAGNLLDVSTANSAATTGQSGASGMRLKTGHDYYLALTVESEQITLRARALSGPSTPLQTLQTVVFPRRLTGGKPFGRLRRPAPETPLKIGNSDGTGRVVGLIDEVRLSRGARTAEEIARACKSSPQDLLRSALAAAEAELRRVESATPRRVAELQLAHAEAELKAIRARVAADNARYRETCEEPQAKQAAVDARRAEIAAAQAAARHAQAEARQALEAAQALKNAAKRTAAIKAAQAKLKKADAQRTAANALNPQTAYAPLGPTYPKVSTGRRRALAQWITRADNPLTARVAVNHLWMRHFGRPLVESVFDFGRSGKSPTHPRLLDWLAVELMAGGWRMKNIHRLIVTSSTYRQSGAASAAQAAENLRRDKDNHLFWRFPRRRLVAEDIRDSILHCAGRLDARMGGPEIAANQEAKSPRRSLYFAIHPEAGGLMPFLGIFDGPNPAECYRRTTSIVPQQALAMANSRLMLDASRTLARRLIAELPLSKRKDADAFITAAFETVLTRAPRPVERARCRGFLEEQTRLLAQASPAALRGKPVAGGVAAALDPQLRARESFVRALMNHHEFVTLP